MLTDARRAYDARAWARAFEAFAAEDAERPLVTEDLEFYAVTAAMLGRYDDYFAIRERIYRELLDRGDGLGAAGSAIWIGIQRIVMGDLGTGSGWIGRAARLIAEDGTDSVPAAYLVVSEGFAAAGAGDPDRAALLCADAAEAGRRLRDADLVSLALHQQGLFLLQAGRADEGLAALDEAMVGLAAGELSPLVTGIVYCGVIGGCWSVYELGRAHEWTRAMGAWCEAQPELGNFTGECRVRRAELKLFDGAWQEAIEELADVSERDVWTSGTATYVRAELDRLQGRSDEAEEGYAEAARLGFEPQPGLALLRLARGSTQAAAAMVRRCLAEMHEPAKRIELLAAATDVLLAVGAPAAAADVVDELGAAAERNGGQIVVALHQHALGAVRLAEDDAAAALPPLRSALRTWVREGTPYQEARTRALLAAACRALDDRESADRETATARRLFEELGAWPDAARLADRGDLLSPRELEVLRLVATGATNKSIAAELVLSERTVDRHVSNILGKLGVPSRAAATARALERELI